MSWCYDEAFRRVHVLFTSPEWADIRGERFDADRLIASLKDANVNCIQMYAKDHWGYCYYDAKLGIPFPIDIFGEVVSKAHAAGIKVLAYFSVGFDEYALGRHPDWRAIDQQGLSRRFRKLFAWACLNTPYREFALEQVREIASKYEIDGFWVDIVPIVMDGVTMGWHWSQDLAQDAAQYPVPCYCHSCRRKFRQQYGRDIPINPSEEDRIISYKFLLDEAAAFIADFRHLVQSYRRDALIMYNAGGALEDGIDDSDANCAEGLAPAHSFQSFTCRWALSQAKPYEIITSSGLPASVKSTWKTYYPVLFDHWTQKPVELLQLETSIAAAHGSNATIGLMPFADGRVEDAQYPALKAAFDRIRVMEPYVKSIQPVSDVGLVLTIEPYQAPHRWADTVNGAIDFHEALLQNHLLYEVIRVSMVQDYSRYQVVVLSNQLTVSDTEASRLRDYVYAGGRLIILGTTSLYDEKGDNRQDFGLADVMGVHYRGVIEDHFGFIRSLAPQLSAGIPPVPILTNRSVMDLEVAEGEVLGWLTRPEAMRTEANTMIWGNPAPDDSRRHPLIVRHSFGKGECLTVAASLEMRGPSGTWSRLLAANMVDLLLPNRSLVTDAPPSVEVVWNRKDHRSVIHLINHQTGDPDRICTPRNKLVLRGLTVKLSEQKIGSVTQIRTIVDQQVQVPHLTSDGWTEFEVPPFAVHTALVIE